MMHNKTVHENESSLRQTSSNPALHSSYSTPIIERRNQPVENTISAHSTVNHFDRQSSVNDVSVLERLVLNVRASISDKNFWRSFVQRNQQNDIDETAEEPQFICDERQENAIYKIYLKRVPSKRSPSHGTISNSHTLIDDNDEDDDDENDIEQDDSNNNAHPTLIYSTMKIYQLKAGTLGKIVECLTNKHGTLDVTHMHILFATYRVFTNTKTLIDTILARYRAVIPASLDMTETVRQKTLKSLSTAFVCLITLYKEDFYEPPAYALLSHLMQQNLDREVKNQCRSLLDRFFNEDDIPDSNSNTYILTQCIDKNNNSRHLHSDNLWSQEEVNCNTTKTFLEMSPVMIAEQLTIVDAELLKRVLPHECLTSRSSNQRRSGSNPTHLLSTVDRTREHFNAVVYRVIATILQEFKGSDRVRIVEKWIDVAFECRKLKNFSSLTAILNGLLSGYIYRLQKTWSQVNTNHRSIFNELKNVFGSATDRKQLRAILDKQLDDIRLALPNDTEATAKYADVIMEVNRTFDKKLRLKASRIQKNTMLGTVPYLGLYLSDLTYIDSAHENYITINANAESPEKLFNFEKRRKQYEILVQIKLFQSAANAYTNLKPVPQFKNWFDAIQILENSENWDRSYEIEPNSTESANKQSKTLGTPSSICRPKPLRAFPSDVSLASWTSANPQVTASSKNSNGSLRSSPSFMSYDKISLMSNRSLPRHPQALDDMSNKKIHSNHSRASSASSFLTKDSQSQGYISAQASPTTSLAHCTSNPVENDSIIAKVRLVGRDELLYKKIRIGNSERTTSVLKTILDKFGLDPSAHDSYCIEQQLPDRKILLVNDCNVFYALVQPTNDDQIQLVVRKKNQEDNRSIKPR